MSSAVNFHHQSQPPPHCQEQELLFFDAISNTTQSNFTCVFGEDPTILVLQPQAICITTDNDAAELLEKADSFLNLYQLCFCVNLFSINVSVQMITTLVKFLPMLRRY